MTLPRPLFLAALALASCHAAAAKPVIKPPPPVVTPPPPVVQPAFMGHVPKPGEVLPLGRTNIYAANMLIAYLVNDGQLFQPPHSPNDTGVSWTVKRDATGLQYWYASGNAQWVITQTVGNGAPWRVGQ